MIRARLRSAQGGCEGGAPALGKGGAVPGASAGQRSESGEELGKDIVGGRKSGEVSRSRGQGIPTQSRRVRPGWREAQARVLNPGSPGQGHRPYALGNAEPKWALSGK